MIKGQGGDLWLLLRVFKEVKLISKIRFSKFQNVYRCFQTAFDIHVLKAQASEFLSINIFNTLVVISTHSIYMQ